jgi:hypothetical protein
MPLTNDSTRSLVSSVQARAHRRNLVRSSDADDPPPSGAPPVSRTPLEVRAQAVLV